MEKTNGVCFGYNKAYSFKENLCAKRNSVKNLLLFF